MKKTKTVPQGAIQKEKAPDVELRFSFKYFDASDAELCPPVFRDNYTQTLMERLKALSSWTVQQFTGAQNKSIRNHTHDWEKTSRPKGFQHLNEQLRSYQSWQFQLTSNAHGRVHGLLIGNIFYIIWLDQDHKLYP